MTYEGASPEIMETDVVDPMEDAITAVEGVKQISSTSRQGQANITVEFELSRNIDVALQDVQTRSGPGRAPAARARSTRPIISKTNPEDQPLLWMSLSGNRSPTFMSDYMRNVLRPQFQTIEGVGEVSMGGFRERNIRVWFDAARLEAQGLAVQDVIDAIEREHLEVPAGRIETPQREMNVRAEGEALNLQEFENLVIAFRGGTPVRLKDVAVVEDGLEDRRRLVARAGASRRMGFAIRKLRGANAVEVGERVHAKVEQVRAQLPEGMDLDINFDSTTFIKHSIDEILFTLLLAAMLTGLVCWVFLGSWSTTLNVLLAIPTSILGTFIVMYFFGFTLNTFTVLGLTLTVGIVVDDAIMVLENIYRHREHGMGKVRGGVGRSARDHVRGGRGDARDRRHLPAGRLHEGDHREVLLPVRRHHLGRGPDLAAGGADAGAHALLALPGGRRADGPLRPCGRPLRSSACRPPTCAGCSRRCTIARWVMVGAARLLRGLRARDRARCLRQEFVPTQDTQPLPDPLPDAGRHQHRRDRRRVPADRGLPRPARRGRALLRLHRRLRRRRGQHRDDCGSP